MNETLTLEQQEALARELYYSLDDINEFGTLLRIGMFPGHKAASITKCDAFFAKVHKETVKKIESNPWYIQEKTAMEAMKMKDVFTGVEGEYDPNYKVTMPDVFRKVVK